MKHPSIQIVTSSGHWTFVAGMIFLMFAIYVTARGHLPQYLSFFIFTPPTAKPQANEKGQVLITPNTYQGQSLQLFGLPIGPPIFPPSLPEGTKPENAPSAISLRQAQHKAQDSKAQNRIAQARLKQGNRASIKITLSQTCRANPQLCQVARGLS
jgi:hypothetical protein